MGAERRRQEDQDRDAEVWRLRVSGWTQARIAAHLGVSQQSVSLYLAKTEKRLYREFVTHAEEVKARQTAQLDQLYDRLTAQFEVSTAEGSGNPALLAQAMAAQAAIRKIWGLDSPERQEITGPEGGPIRITEIVVEVQREETGE